MMLYREVSYLDFKTFLPSGRSEGGDGFTVDNLEKEGFHEWVKFIPSGKLDRDDNHRGSKCVQRRMAARPWENRLLRNDAIESMPVCDDNKHEETKSQVIPKVKVPISSRSTPNGPNKMKGVNHKK